MHNLIRNLGYIIIMIAVFILAISELMEMDNNSILLVSFLLLIFGLGYQVILSRFFHDWEIK